jgi:glycosyltransferase involved in cell wall biosynthesis
MTRSPLKVLMLTSSYPRSRKDTASIFLRHLAESLAARGIDMHVLAPADGRGGTKVEDNINVYRFRYLPAKLQKLAYGSGILSNLKRQPWLWLQVPFFLVAMNCALLKLIRRHRPDLIHAHWVLPQGLIAVLAKYFFRIPVMTTAHGADTFALQGKVTNRLKQFVVAKSDAWTSNTRATSQAIGESASLPKPHVIPMGVNVKFFSGGDRTRLRRELPQDDLLVLFVGRLVEKKGCYDLLHAYSLLSPSLRGRTNLWIIGDGDESVRLQKYTARIGAGAKIRFWGTISNSLLPDFYSAADLLVVPSIEAESGDTEGLGVVLLEAFAANTCVLATRVGGIGEVVQDDLTGMLAAPHDPKQLASAIERILSDDSLRAKLAKNAFAKVGENGWEKIAERFEALYRQIVQPKKRHSSASTRFY